MNNLTKIPFYNKLIIFLTLFSIGFIYISYKLYNKIEYVDYSLFDIYKKEYIEKKEEIEKLNNRLEFLKSLEKKFNHKYVNKNDLKYFISDILNIYKKLNLIGNFKIIDISYDNKYINMVHVKIKFYDNILDKEIAKDIFEYMFNNIIDKNMIKLDKIYVDKKENILYLTLYK